VTPELHLLLLICRSRANAFELQREEFATIVNDGIDWLEFLRLVLYHRMVPIVFPLIENQLAEVLPEGIKDILVQRFKRNRLRALNTSSELLRLLDLMQKQEIQVINLKGPPLAEQLYGDIANRHCGDIDLLARPDDIARLHQIVSKEGYITQGALPNETFSSARHLRAYLAAQYHTSYFHPARGIRLEIHFSLFKNRHYFPHPTVEDFDNQEIIRAVKFGKTAIKKLTPADDILYLLAHGANHKWFRLKWLLDIGLLCHVPDTPWESVVQRAQELQLERTVAQGLMLTHLLLDCPLPAAFEGIKVKASLQQRLTDDALREIQRTKTEIKRTYLFPQLRKKPYLMRLKPGLLYKLAHLRMLFYFDANRQVLLLPERLFFLYYILNPFLWLYRKMFKTISKDKPFIP
jgi:Uncharacterised nucleotidyltransferase